MQRLFCTAKRKKLVHAAERWGLRGWMQRGVLPSFNEKCRSGPISSRSGSLRRKCEEVTSCLLTASYLCGNHNHAQHRQSKQLNASRRRQGWVEFCRRVVTTSSYKKSSRRSTVAFDLVAHCLLTSFGEPKYSRQENHAGRFNAVAEQTSPFFFLSFPILTTQTSK